MAFGTLEDYRGEIELVFFEKCWEQNKDRLKEKSSIALSGKLDQWRQNKSFIVNSILDLEKLQINAEKTAAAKTAAGKTAVVSAADGIPASAKTENLKYNNKNKAEQKATQELHIRLLGNMAENEKNLYPLRDYLIDHPGSALVFIHVNETIIRTDVRFAADREQLLKLGENPMISEVWVA